jgi:hypothetical protein
MGTPVAESLALQHQSPIVINGESPSCKASNAIHHPHAAFAGPVGIGKYLDAFKTYSAQHPVVVREQGRFPLAGIACQTPQKPHI